MNQKFVVIEWLIFDPMVFLTLVGGKGIYHIRNGTALGNKRFQKLAGVKLLTYVELKICDLYALGTTASLNFNVIYFSPQVQFHIRTIYEGSRYMNLFCCFQMSYRASLLCYIELSPIS